MRHKIKKTKETKRFSDVKTSSSPEVYQNVYVSRFSDLFEARNHSEKEIRGNQPPRRQKGTKPEKSKIREWVQRQIKLPINAGRQGVLSHKQWSLRLKGGCWK